ncbi:uncharacterized protein LOC124172481 isoform X2 [Ischnura elegans]|nr:uncharacterized protein LOC124172481 isoform X2 [Ischnura elegans]
MKQACHIPVVNPWDESVKPFVERPHPFKCPSPPPMSYLAACPGPSNDEDGSSTSDPMVSPNATTEGTLDLCQRPAHWPASLQPPPLLTLNLSHVHWSEDLNCCAAELTRGGPKSKSDLKADFRFKVGECKPFHHATPLVSEFTVVNCTKGSKEVYADIHGYAIPGETTLEKMARASDKSTQPTSILLVGIDSSSRLNFLRAMPKTRAVLERAGAIGMNAYNKVGDNTFPNLLAILAGTSEEDALGMNKQTTKPKGYRCWPNTVTVVDNCPYLFKSFSNEGYVTLFTEDQPDLGTFTYAKKGFRNQPTDHYVRPYYLFAQSRLKVTQMKLDWCYSNRESHLRTMDYVRSFLGTYHSKVPFFGLVYFTSMSHNSPPDIELVDDDMAEFMRDLIEVADAGMEKNGEGMFLAFLSDHGARFGKLRESPLGWLEERVPFLYIRPPLKFNETRGPATSYQSLVKSQYPALVLNRKRLTSPFDLHFTLSSYLPGNTRPDSSCAECYDLLSQVVPLNRTCSDAAVPNKWCACAKRSTISVDDPDVAKASMAAVKYINYKLFNNKECARLKMESIVAAHHLSIKTQAKERNVIKLLEVTFTTVPGEAIFEASTLKNKDGGFFLQFDPNRLNSYGNQSSCVTEAKLKLYCFCA